MTLINDTVVNNTSSLAGAGVSRNAGTVSAGNTIIANNTSITTTNEDVFGTFTSQGGNLVEVVTGGVGFTQPTDQTGADPNLQATLTDNGGPTLTHAPNFSAVSPVIDRGVTALFANAINSTDQRGSSRVLSGPIGNAIDRGAVEFGGFFVNTTSDTPDVNPGDGNALDGLGNTSLRAAIMEANALAGENDIILGSQTYTLTHTARDTTAPTVTGILGVPTTVTTSTVGVVTINFSEAVGGFDLADLNLTLDGAGVSLAGLTLTKVNNSQYTIDLTTVTATDGHYLLTVNSGAAAGIRDADGNLLAANASVNWDRGTDTTQPTVTLPVVTTPRLLNAGVLRFEFSEQVTQVSNANFTLTRNVGAGPVNVPITSVPTTIVSDTNFNGRTIVTLDLSAAGLTNIDGTYVLTLTTTVSGLSIRDVATTPNTLAGAATRTVTWAKQRGVDVIDVSPDPRIGAVSSVTVQFSEQVARVQLSDFSLTYDDLSGNGRKL